jgi:hypothetical protein
MPSSSAVRCLAAGLVWLAACGGGAAPSPVPTPYQDPVSTGPTVPAAEVRAIVGVLAADSMEGRLTGTAGSARAARYLAGRMRSYGLEPAGDSGYYQRVAYEVVRGPAGNELRLPGTGTADSAVGRVADATLIGVVRGPDSLLRREAVVVGAHFDHMGVGPAVAGDSVYNGADDDASGVAAMLVAARALTRQKNENLGDAADEIVSEFKQHFVDTKLFWDQYAHGKFSQYFFKAYEQPAQDPSKETAHQLVEEAQLFVDAAYQCYSKTGNLAGGGMSAPV